MTQRHPLTQIVADNHIFSEEVWNKHHILLKNAISPGIFPDVNEIWGFLERPLMRSPYYSVVKEGEWARPEAVTRQVAFKGEAVDDLADIDGIKAGVNLGASIKLNQMEDWHRPTRTLLEELRGILAAEFKAYIFYTPAGGTGMRPHRDPAHVLAVQLAGSKRWRIWEHPDQIDARAGLDVDPTGWTDEFVMEAGDLLYLPHGVPHAPSAESATSLHLTITITEPGPIDLCETLVTSLLTHRPQLAASWPRLRNEDRVAAVFEGLESLVEELDENYLIDMSANQMADRKEL